MEKWQEELAYKMLSSNKSLTSRGLGKSAFLAYLAEHKSATEHTPVPHVTVDEWQTPWSGEYDPMNHAPNGSWYGRGLTSRVERPLTVHKMASMISYSQSDMGGIPPTRWELSRELAEELAADAATQWFMSGTSPSDAMKQIADGTLKICDVPIVLENTTQKMPSEISRSVPSAYRPPDACLAYLNPAKQNEPKMQAVTPGLWCDADVVCLEQDLRYKSSQILRLVEENNRLRGVLEVALKAANPLYKVNVLPTKDDITRGYELVCGGFGTFAEPDVAPSPTVASKPPIPLRALRTDRQTIGLRE